MPTTYRCAVSTGVGLAPGDVLRVERGVVSLAGLPTVGWEWDRSDHAHPSLGWLDIVCFDADSLCGGIWGWICGGEDGYVEVCVS